MGIVLNMKMGTFLKHKERNISRKKGTNATWRLENLLRIKKRGFMYVKPWRWKLKPKMGITFLITR